MLFWDFGFRFSSMIFLVTVVGGCYLSSGKKGEPWDSSIEDDIPWQDGSDSIEVPPADISFPDAGPDGTATLVPEGDETFFHTESGMEVEVHSGLIIPAAFSGEIYEIIMDEQSPSSTSGTRVAVYRLEPGGEVLGTSWIDEAEEASQWASICWTGEVFVALLPTPSVGLRLLAVDESGELVRPVEVLEADPDYAIQELERSPIVLCPEEGPFIIDRTDGEDGLLLLSPDGSSEGLFVPTTLPPFALNMSTIPCTEAGAEAVCATDDGIVFIRRSGEVRQSESTGDESMGDSYHCDVAYTGESVALIWASEVAEDDLYLRYALFDLDGRLVVPPVTSDPLNWGPLGIHAASSGSTIFVASEGNEEPQFNSPRVHLLELGGHSLSGPVPLSGYCPYSAGGLACPEPGGHWRGVAVFWEGDAYSAIWNTWPVQLVAYRRFDVVM